MRIRDEDDRIRNALAMIRLAVDGRPKSQQMVSTDAYYAWQRGGSRDGNDLGDWYAAECGHRINGDYYEILNEMKKAAERGDFRVQLGLSAVNNVASLLGMRPTELFLEYMLDKLDFRQLRLIVAGISHDLGYRFTGNYCHAFTIGSLVRRMWDVEYLLHAKSLSPREP